MPNKKGGASAKDSGGVNETSGVGMSVEVESYIEDVEYPATKQDLIDMASDNDAPEEAIEALNKIADREYESPTEVSKEIGKQK